MTVFLSIAVFCGEAHSAVYIADASQGEILFEVSSTLHQVHGHANEWSGRVDFDPASGTMRVPFEVHVPVRSLVTDHKGRDKAMLKMFEDKRYPDAVWKIESWSCPSFEAGQPASCLAKGPFQIHGKSSVHEAVVQVIPLKAGFEVKTEMDLTTPEFDLVPPSVLGLIRVAQKVTVNIRTVWSEEK